MSYDLWLIPTAFADDIAAARTHAIAQNEAQTPATAEATALAEAIMREHGPLEDEGFLSVWPLSGDGDCVFVPSIFPAVDEARSMIYPLAFAAGFAVYDPQIDVLADPRNALSGSFVSAARGRFPVITPGLVDHFGATMDVEDYIIAETADHTYIQSKRIAADEFILEYRAGSPDRHFGTTVTTAGEVVAAVHGWLTGDDSSYRELRWDRVVL